MLRNTETKGARMGMASSAVFGLTLAFTALISVLAGCGNGELAQNDASDTNKNTQSSAGTAAVGDSTAAPEAVVEDTQEFTPIVGQVLDAPIPFAGSDGRTHLVYELEATNFTSGKTAIEQLEVLDADTDDVVATLGAEKVEGRLQPAGLREAFGTLAPSMAAIIFVHVTFDEAEEVPARLVHRLSLKAAAAPPDQQQIAELAAPTDVDRRNVVAVGPPP